MLDAPRFNAFHLAFLGEQTRLELEDEPTDGTLVEALRELSQWMADLADYYEVEGTDSLFE